MFVRYQLWMLGDDGMYPHHTNELDEALNIAFESPSFHSCDINFGVGMQVTVKTAEELESSAMDFTSQTDYANSMRRESYEQTMKRLYDAEKSFNKHVLEDAHEFGMKPVDNTLHRFNSINMGITSCRGLVDKELSVDSELFNELHKYLDFIKDNLDKLQLDRKC
jgi:hypothetical protein